MGGGDFIDVPGRKTAVMVSADDSSANAFAPYANSYFPLLILGSNTNSPPQTISHSQLFQKGIERVPLQFQFLLYLWRVNELQQILWDRLEVSWNGIKRDWVRRG